MIPFPHGLPHHGWTRNFPAGVKNYFRVYAGEKIPIEITPVNKEKIPLAKIRLICQDPVGENSKEYFFERSGGSLRLELQPEIPGKYAFRVLFSTDGGLTWCWDPAPYSHFLVDPPSISDLRVYTLVPNVSGSMESWIKRLDEIQNMGFNSILLLPITYMDASNSPYSAFDLFEIDPRYKTPGDTRSAFEQFEDFFRELKRRGMRLCLDLVLNHVGITSKIVKEHPVWILPDEKESDGLKRAGWWNGEKWVPWVDLALLDYNHPEWESRNSLWETMTNVALLWARYAAESGGFIRLDNFHSTHKSFAKHILLTMKRKYPNLPVLAEFFDLDENLKKTCFDNRLDLFLATPWEEKFVPQLRGYLRYIHGSSPQIRFFLPITSHDSGTPQEEFGSALATLPRYAVSALMGLGPTGIVQGVEDGLDRRLNFCRPPTEVTWERRYDFRAVLGGINEIHGKWDLFRQAGNLKFIDGDHEAIIGVTRQGKDGTHFLILANFDIHSSQHLELNLNGLSQFASWRSYTDCLNNRTQQISHLHWEIEMEPCGVRVYRME